MTSYFFIGHVTFTLAACVAIMAWQWTHALRIVDTSMRRQDGEQTEVNAPESEVQAEPGRVRATARR